MNKNKNEDEKSNAINDMIAEVILVLLFALTRKDSPSFGHPFQY